ncbi:MAG: hypothetical protein KAV82_15820 [Phycisphaerae bacterium]|nr:hypothetical protein [Phycisphaerae bacterium]
MRHHFKVVCAVACLSVMLGCRNKKENYNNPATADATAVRQQVPSEAEKQTQRVEFTLELTGPGLGKPRVFSFKQLAGMEMTRIDQVMMLKTHEPDKKGSWQGPSLESLLAASKIKPGPMELIVKAVDGYEMHTTLKEMRSAIIALQDGKGRWLSEIDKTCSLRLIPPNQPGNYWVMNPQRITVKPESGS